MPSWPIYGLFSSTFMCTYYIMCQQRSGSSLPKYSCLYMLSMAEDTNVILAKYSGALVFILWDYNS